jgi:peptide/nickel transport system permease protein
VSLIGRILATAEGATGLAILAAMAALALAAPWLFPGDPLAIAGPPMQAPFEGWQHPLGTDRLGRDVAAGIVHGARTSLAVGLAAAAAALTIGALVGTLAGLLGGWTDEALMRVTEAFQTVPTFLLALAFVSVGGGSVLTVVAAIALSSWTEPARLARSEVLAIREMPYVANARVAGMHPVAIALREVLPNALPPVLALSAVIVAASVLIEAALSFLGLGDPNVATWGGMIAEGRAVLRSAPWLSVLPGLAVMVTVLGVYLAGEGLAEALARRKGRA